MSLMPTPHSLKPPSLVFPDAEFENDAPKLFAFPPNRHTMGGTAYLLVQTQAGQPSTVLIDCPAWTPEVENFLQQQGGVQWLVITHRGGMDQVQAMQKALTCQVIIQEQEAYLLPNVDLQTFQQGRSLNDTCEVIWTPGHSPGSACVYGSAYGGILFTGRHWLPNQQGHPLPLRTAKTFHWQRQLRSFEILRDRLATQPLSYLCPGANTGFLRGKRAIANAHHHLHTLDLAALQQAEIIRL